MTQIRPKQPRPSALPWSSTRGQERTAFTKSAEDSVFGVTTEAEGLKIL